MIYASYYVAIDILRVPTSYFHLQNLKTPKKKTITAIPVRSLHTTVVGLIRIAETRKRKKTSYGIPHH